MNKLLILFLIISISSAQADVVNPLPTLKNDLESLLKIQDGRKSFVEMKVIANDKNTDVDIAFENYLIAKRNVGVARSKFNPLATGQILGAALGFTYFWAPIAIEAVLSIPTKIYNVSKNHYLKKASLYNLYDARSLLTNELAHLYYDILNHEVILKSIDKELDVLNYEEELYVKSKVAESSINSLQKDILVLSKQRLDIYEMYTSELAAIRTLISTTDATKYELAQVSEKVSKSFLDGLDKDNLEEFALMNSNKYKAAVNMQKAFHSNLRQVQWSILSFSGLNFSYRRRIKDARNEESLSILKKSETELVVKNNLLLQIDKLSTSIDLSENYDAISEDSLRVFSDTYQMVQMGQINEFAAIETALGAIRDFRNKVTTHYAAWSALNDFSTSANFDFKDDSSTGSMSAQSQVEKNPMYQVKAQDFKILKHVEAGVSTLSIESSSIGLVSEVDYSFSDKDEENVSSTKSKEQFASVVPAKFEGSTISGTATVRLINGHEFNIKFNL